MRSATAYAIVVTAIIACIGLAVYWTKSGIPLLALIFIPNLTNEDIET